MTSSSPSFTIEVTQQQARILNELTDMLALEYEWLRGRRIGAAIRSEERHGGLLENLAESAQATQDEIEGTMESVFNQTYLIMEGRQ